MLKQIWARIAENYNPDAIGDWLNELIPELVSAALIMVAFYLVWLVVGRVIRLIDDRTEIDETLLSFIKTTTKTVLFTIALISALAEIGINTGAMITSLGVAGLTIGFAAKDTLSNLISGIFIFWDRPFVLDDLVEIDGIYGRVHQITLRSTRVVTVDGKMIAIPNTMIVNSKVASYTNFPNLRLDIDITLGVEEDLPRARSLFLALIADDDRYLDTPAPAMVVSAINDYNVGVQFRVWLKDEKTHLLERFALRERIFEALRQNDVVMPFETFEVVLPQQKAAS